MLVLPLANVNASPCASPPRVPRPVNIRKEGVLTRFAIRFLFSIDNLVTVLVHYPRKVVRPGPARRFCFKAIFVAPASLPALLSQQAIPNLNSKETFMSTLSPKDRVCLCSFTFSDGRRCRTPRTRNNPRFCAYHAQKEARARTAQKLGKDLAYFFSGDYLSACDLSTALARLIPAVVRGDVKPKTAHTVAYLVQTLMQAVHISQHEYINAFGTNGWRESVRNSVKSNYDYRFPPDPEPEQSAPPQPQPAAVAHPGIHPDPVGRGEAFPSASPPQHPATPNPSAKATPPQPAEIPPSC